MIRKIGHSLFFVLILGQMHAQILDSSWRELVSSKSYNWFKTEEARNIGENVLLYQRDIGGWPKNIAIHMPLTDGQKEELLNLKSNPDDCTIDNGATYLEMTYLAKLYDQIPDEKYKEAFLKGLDYILAAQYENGGWPQFYPLKEGYYSHITYNDDAMANVLKLLRDIMHRNRKISKGIDDDTMARVNEAFDRGIDCILKTQYRQHGVLTGWCAQYDENTLQPAKARAYELPSLSGKESAPIVLLLMDIPNPSKEVRVVVDSAVDWFEKTKITGLLEIRYHTDDGLEDKKYSKDSLALPVWARFMDLEDNTPFFCDRDGIKKTSIMDIGRERRAGYAWYSQEAQQVLDKYPKWKASHDKVAITKKHRDEYNITVAQDGSGDYTTIQEAIYNCKAFPYQRITIHIKNGTYREKVKIPEWNPNIALIGESREKTIISYADYFDGIALGRNSTFHTYTLLVEGDDFHAANLTVENTAGDMGQAVALAVNADRVKVENCTIKGHQDTFYATGNGNRQYFEDCWIEGTTDFIFGEGTVLFEDCVIHSKKDSYITAASTPKGMDYGFVFRNCRLTADKGVDKVYLGRPWRIYAKTVFLNCTMGNHILPEGWHNWNKPEAEKTSFYAEYRSKNEEVDLSKRASWSHILSPSEAKKYTISHILGKDPWYNR